MVFSNLKFSVIFLLILSLRCCGQYADYSQKEAQGKNGQHSGGDPFVTERFFEQRNDHFVDPNQTGTFIQRYFENLAFFKPYGPVFLILSGEGEVQPDHIGRDRTLLSQLAELYGGALFILEHRYYGKSVPQGNYTKYEFLSSRQAIEDAAYFVRSMRERPQFMTSRWIVSGCSYSGSLATWFRARYPSLTAGAIAFSAPLEVQIDFEEYKTAVSESLWRISEPCAGRLRDALELLNAELQLDLDNRIETLNSLSLGTENLTIYEPNAIRERLMTEILFVMGGMLQTRTQDDIRLICRDRVENLRYPLLSVLSHLFQNKTNFEESGYDLNGWSYQLCNEFGWFVASAEAEDDQDVWPNLFNFNVSLENASGFCRGIFGDEFVSENINRKVAETKDYYGGRVDLNVSNVLFVEGENDPWRPLQMEAKYLKGTNVLVIIKGGTHCEGMFPNMQPEVRNAQAIIHSRVLDWIGLPNPSDPPARRFPTRMYDPVGGHTGVKPARIYGFPYFVTNYG
ncbi:unnamed protein product [Bursaphelenchus xylophilus]|uniref:(pine wood nematode) hypothetical protein n=1 Tax=Bursaphelenchus xylophilus TaxID=6326 RepID=A0A1I7S0M4_BURXY|nr:unnamed protein product [Bursaphelenchus xylophilus]CAG9132349.1 unnamed protein product [Bursaphelenchus xylophilus]